MKIQFHVISGTTSGLNAISATVVTRHSHEQLWPGQVSELAIFESAPSKYIEKNMIKALSFSNNCTWTEETFFYLADQVMCAQAAAGYKYRYFITKLFNLLVDLTQKLNSLKIWLIFSKLLFYNSNNKH